MSEVPQLLLAQRNLLHERVNITSMTRSCSNFRYPKAIKWGSNRASPSGRDTRSQYGPTTSCTGDAPTPLPEIAPDALEP